MSRNPFLKIVMTLMLLATSGAVLADGPLRVMTFNMGAGASRVLMPQLLPVDVAMRGMAPMIARAAGEGDAVICLQEVDDGRSRSGAGSVDDLVAALNSVSTRNGWTAHYYPLSDHGNDGTTGIAILSRLAQPSEAVRWKTFEGGEDRGALALRADLGGKPVWVVNTHMGFTDPRSQVASLIDGIERHATDATVVLCGDLNIPDPAVSRYPLARSVFQGVFSPLIHHGFVSATADSGPTYPAWAKRLGVKLDYFFVRARDGLFVKGTDVLDPRDDSGFLSDHRALSLDLAAPTSAGGVGYAD